MTAIAALTFAVALAACAPGPAPEEGGTAEPMTMTLEVPRPPAADEVVWARVAAGDLPPGARLLVRMAGGELAGSVDQYARQPGQADAGIHTIPLPQEAIEEGRVTLLLEVEEEIGGASRVPREGEVLEVELILVPVTP